MANEIISTKEVPEFIADTLHSASIKLEKITNGKYHHNRTYKTAPLVCKYGILTLLDQNKLGLRKDSIEFLEKMDDESSHINGIEGVSLSIPGLTDLARDEEEYNPFNPSLVDFIISSSIKARRNTRHYGNEFITTSVKLEDILTLDIRILDYLAKTEKLPTEKVIEMYNSLLQAANNLKRTKSGILLREMSSKSSFSIDINKLSKSKKLVLKK